MLTILFYIIFLLDYRLFTIFQQQYKLKTFKLISCIFNLSYRTIVLYINQQQFLIKKLFMANNIILCDKSIELKQRLSSRVSDNNFNKVKSQQSLRILSMQALDKSHQYNKNTKDISNKLAINNLKNLKRQKSKLETPQRTNSSNKKNFQLFQNTKTHIPHQNSSNKLQKDQCKSVKFYNPISQKNFINHSNSVKILNLTANNLNRKQSPQYKSINTTQINVSQNKYITKKQRSQDNQSTLQLLNSIKKSSQLIAQTKNFNLMKRYSIQNSDKQIEDQKNIKNILRQSQPRFFPLENQDYSNINLNNDTVNEFRNSFTKQKTDFFLSDQNNLQNSCKERQSFYNDAFKKQKDLKQTVSTHSTFNSVQKTNLKNPKNYIVESIQKQTLKISDFIKGKQLGSGKFGTVTVVSHKKTGFICAMKTIPKIMIKEQKLINQFIRQIKIQSCLDHPNIIKLYGFFQDKNYIYLLLELGSEGHLYKLLKQKKRFSESLVINIMRQLCEALKYLHSLNIIHRDIKPQNIVIQYGTIKLCDFGWAVKSGAAGQLRKTFCGTPLYVCPEILKGELYDEKIDVWSVGILAYELLVGQIPFEIANQSQLIKIINQDIIFPNNINISHEAKDFVLKILKKNPEERLKIAKLLQHPFLQRNIDASQFKF